MECFHTNIRGIRTNLGSLLPLVEQESTDQLQVQATKTHLPLTVQDYTAPNRSERQSRQ